MKRYIFENLSKRSLMASKRWVAFKKSNPKYAYFLRLSFKGERKSLPENAIVPFCINLANHIGHEIYVDGVYWDGSEDSRRNTHIHLVVGCAFQLKSPEVKVAWSKGIIDFAIYDMSIEVFNYMFRGEPKLPHLPIAFKDHVFKPSQQRTRRFR